MIVYFDTKNKVITGYTTERANNEQIKMNISDDFSFKKNTIYSIDYTGSPKLIIEKIEDDIN